jgi:hypothetical protein
VVPAAALLWWPRQVGWHGAGQSRVRWKLRVGELKPPLAILKRPGPFRKRTEPFGWHTLAFLDIFSRRNFS